MTETMIRILSIPHWNDNFPKEDEFMGIRYLEEFLVLTRYMNFTTAAKYLNLTQSALSKHIASLEREFDGVFFNRASQNIELTEQGRIFCVDAQKMLDLYRSAQDRLKSTVTAVRLAGAVDDAATLKLITTARTKLTETDPDFALLMNSDAAQPLLDLLMTRRINLYIDIALEDDRIDESCDTCILATVPLIAIINCQHPLVKHESISAADLTGHSIMYPTGSISSLRGADAVGSFFRRHHISPGSSIFFARSIKDFPFATIGDNVLVTPRSNFSKQFFPNIMENHRAIPFRETDAVFPYRLVWRKDESSTRVLAFRDMLIAVSEQLHPGNRSLLYQQEPCLASIPVNATPTQNRGT
jgi:DNA-binding transcriptional LysR family regulator